jgi:hypothetical protein
VDRWVRLVLLARRVRLELLVRLGLLDRLVLRELERRGLLVRLDPRARPALLVRPVRELLARLVRLAQMVLTERWALLVLRGLLEWASITRDRGSLCSLIA